MTESRETVSGTRPYQPSWWSVDIEKGWAHVRSDELSRWYSCTTDRVLENRILEMAVAFGWGAYQFYTPTTLWGPALEARLGTDWERTGHPPGGGWTSVVSAVRHGWDRAYASSV